MCEELKLERYDQAPWGFRLTGGLDFGTPLSVIKVTGGSVAEMGGVQVGDLVLEINGKNAKTMTHTDAQGCIAAAKNRLNLSIMRGSLVTPQELTPLRGMTPMIDNEMARSKNQLNPDLLSKHLNQAIVDGIHVGSNCEDGMKEAPLVHESIGSNAQILNVNSKIISTHCEEKVDIIKHGIDPNVTEMELAELLTGNEEVLDQGVLGINFQKFIPQVDFIRDSEVFKFLQKENVKKEIPEEVQLKQEPTKRFSTFLMKPKPPVEHLKGPFWHYPKAPNYLPRNLEEKKEQPKRRIIKEPPPKPEEGHTVLWLFLGESGENVIDERWGNEEEERINLSRNENREEDNISIASGSSKMKNTGRESCTEGTISESERERDDDMIQSSLAEDLSERNEYNVKEEMEQESDYTEETSGRQEEMAETEVEQSSSKTTTQFSSQLADIQAQIAALDEQAPSELQTQLVAVQQQLAKIAKLQMSTSKRIERKEEVQMKLEKSIKYETKVDYEEENYEKHSESKNIQMYSEREEIEEETKSIQEEIETEVQTTVEYETETFNEVEELEKGEYEIWEAAPPPTPPPAQKKAAHPLTPQMRPIVLPGGRMWRQPKDAAHEEFYQGILVAQAEVLVGSTVGVNFTKYVPPKFDMSHSEVYRLIHEIEDKTKGLQQRGKLQSEKDYYSTPISKKHFYLASLPQPKPMGEVELQDL